MIWAVAWAFGALQLLSAVVATEKHAAYPDTPCYLSLDRCGARSIGLDINPENLKPGTCSQSP